MVDHINNGESGLSVREKLNEVIDRTNTLNGVENQVETNKQNIAKNTTEITELWAHVGDVEDTIKDLDVSVLDDKIDQEIIDRTEGDAALQGQIDQEITDRADGDAALQAQIDGFENYDDTQIKADLATETQARIDGDDGLQGQIDAIVAQPGAGMVISDTQPEPEDRVEGLQWLDSTTAEVWIWDGERWLEFPVSGAGGADLPEMASDAVADTLVLRDENANAKFNLITTKSITFSNPTIFSNTADTWFLSGGETSSNGVRKNDADGMRSSLDVYTKAEVQNKIDAIPEPAQPFFTDIGSNTIEYFGDQLWVTSLREPFFVGAKIGNDSSFTGTVTANKFVGEGTFSGNYADLSGKPTLYSGADAVKTSGNQTIAGIKTFNEDIRGKKNVIAYYSDVRLKDIQGPIENPIEKVKAIETFYYTHGDRARELGYEGSEIQVGVSAQSVQAVAPELIHRAPVDDDGEGGSVTGESYITVDYPRLVPLLIESIKQLSAEIDELKK